MRQNKTQKELAERTGLSKQYLSSLLRGHAKGRIGVWLKILDELGLELIVQRKE